MTSTQRIGLALAAATVGALGLALAPASPASAAQGGAECPRVLKCDWVPAAYQQTGDPANKEAYGNYDLSDRPHTNKIKYIVLHDTEETFATTLKIFQDPKRAASAHYVVRSGDGHVTQMVKTKDVAWQAGNWYMNTESIGIEQEGYATEGATWYTPEMYRSTAALVRYLAAKYDIPLDRRHILGHDNVPPTSQGGTAAMHWDPGPYWDWNHFMSLLGRPTEPTGRPGGQLVTVNPVFKKNLQAIRDCEKNIDLPVQPSSAVPLYTEPSTGAPLFADPGLHPPGRPGTNCAGDWGSKISATQQAVVADRRPGWTAIWWYGQKAWFQSPEHTRTTTPTAGYVVRPKQGLTDVPVYGTAYPVAGDYPAGFTSPRVSVPLAYTIKAGQSYPGGEPTPAGYYYAPTIDSSYPYDHTFFPGSTRFVTVQIGHRIAFVKASDVDVVRVR
ncbi:N-acetylmuramoyl-L-alanine amidase [Streptomyces sp. SDr-06]|uniref:N-acetylmuramoyl-L-alanine amidase n=1 Tax=Streptomyces sp. SDr-06 TaxID=2267702 RepID=UPI000DEB876C|nr:peptidoglycan recognition family protein [Streptomyces sp. SDr-06]RCH70315.1 N-acetylmuramoyl-L-alanine amidase [Streptomyces sp. SDr-06]